DLSAWRRLWRRSREWRCSWEGRWLEPRESAVSAGPCDRVSAGPMGSARDTAAENKIQAGRPDSRPTFSSESPMNSPGMSFLVQQLPYHLPLLLVCLGGFALGAIF